MPRNDSWVFTDYITGDRCFLVVQSGVKPGIRHPKCPVMADIIVELDAFYCLECHYSGRISGAWARDILAARA